MRRQYLIKSLGSLFCLLCALACDSSTSGAEAGAEAGVEAGLMLPSPPPPAEAGSEAGAEAGSEAGSEAGAELPLLGDPELELGTGFRAFEPLEEAQEVPIIAGIQGGFHVWGAFRGRGFDPHEVNIFFTLTLEGEVIAEADYFEFELPLDRRGERFVYTGVSVIYYENERVEPSSGNEMTLHVTLTTRDGLVLEDERQLVPVCCENAF